MSASALSQFMSAAATCTYSMLKSADYIQGELPQLKVSEAMGEQIMDVCEHLVGTKHDVQTEISDLGELDAAVDSEVVQGRVRRIEAWLSEEIPRLHAVVTALEPTGSVAYILVAESVVNIMNSFREVRDAGDRYRAALRDPVSA